VRITSVSPTLLSIHRSLFASIHFFLSFGFIFSIRATVSGIRRPAGSFIRPPPVMQSRRAKHFERIRASTGESQLSPTSFPPSFLICGGIWNERDGDSSSDLSSTATKQRLVIRRACILLLLFLFSEDLAHEPAGDRLRKGLRHRSSLVQFFKGSKRTRVADGFLTKSCISLSFSQCFFKVHVEGSGVSALISLTFFTCRDDCRYLIPAPKSLPLPPFRLIRKPSAPCRRSPRTR